MIKWISTALLLTGLAGCNTTPPVTLYHWGSYQTLVNDMYVEPGSADAATQIAQLTIDIEQANNLGKAVPPGLYAHLGMLYAMIGNEEQSRLSYQQEKALYPESAHLINSMMARAQGAEGEQQ